MTTIAFGDCPCGERGALYAGMCHWCRLSLDLTGRPLDPAPAAAPATIAAAIIALVDELAEDVPQPLAARLTLASVAADLCRLAGEPIPAAVAAALDAEPVTPHPAHTARRAGYPVAALTREPYQEPA